MVRKFAGLLFATLIGVALSGITACDQSGPADTPAMQKSMDKIGEAAEGAADQVRDAKEEAADQVRDAAEEANQ
jgi:hypothetical protein